RRGFGAEDPFFEEARQIALRDALGNALEIAEASRALAKFRHRGPNNPVEWFVADNLVQDIQRPRTFRIGIVAEFFFSVLRDWGRRIARILFRLAPETLAVARHTIVEGFLAREFAQGDGLEIAGKSLVEPARAPHLGFRFHIPGVPNFVIKLMRALRVLERPRFLQDVEIGRLRTPAFWDFDHSVAGRPPHRPEPARVELGHPL